jgi:hypothetical protein
MMMLLSLSSEGIFFTLFKILFVNLNLISDFFLLLIAYLSLFIILNYMQIIKQIKKYIIAGVTCCELVSAFLTL